MHRTRNVTGGPLLSLADIDYAGTVGKTIENLGWVNLVDPALDLSEDFSSGRAHR
jgi:hypothetical protein